MTTRGNPAQAQRLRQLREALGFRPNAFARAIGMSPQRWSNYETGHRRIDVDVLCDLNRRLGVSIDWIVRGEPLSRRVGA